MNIAYKCLKCEGMLLCKVHSMSCEACGAQWPILNNVPCFSSAKYFGEVSQTAMQKLVKAAEEGNWLLASEEMFKDTDTGMYQYIADLNRASWIPILPIGPESTVLDVGAGLGVLTHALALQFEKVVSVEPITERVNFTRVRLEQEGLKHVDLVQTTLDSLPFFDRTFDAIILNGILEWVGEWRVDESPRAAQVSTLIALRRLLKPGGLMLIGIENRIGWDQFLGRVDHPGTRFTSLMPRWMASLYVKMTRPAFYRTVMDSTQGYRTYTYSPRGYVKLLNEAGFSWVDLWWPRQGYNLPHVMFKTSDYSQIRSHFTRNRNYKNRVHGHSLLRAAKDWVLIGTGLLKTMFPDVILMARVPSSVEVDAHGSSLSLPEEICRVVSKYVSGSVGIHNKMDCHASVLISRSFRNKAIVLLAKADETCCAIAKVANVKLAGSSTIGSAYEWLQYLHGKFSSPAHPLHDSIPAPFEILRVGSLVVSVESIVKGRAYEDICMAPDYFKDRAQVKQHLSLVVRWLGLVNCELEAWRVERGGFVVPREWWKIPAQKKLSWEGLNVEMHAFVQHGDFFPDNVFLSEEANQISVIDWDQCGDGYPPLFDWFCLVTGMYYLHGRISRLPKGETAYDLSFRQTYFEYSWFSEIVVELSFRLCDQFNLERTMLSEYFRSYLAVRYHQFEQKGQSERDNEWRDKYRGFYELFVEHENDNIFKSALVGQS